MEINGPGHSISQHGRRKLASGLNAAVALALAGLLMGMLNYLASRHYYRADWSRAKFYSLSDKTKGLLAGLTNRLDIIALLQPEHDAFSDAENLLKEYEYASKLVHVEFVDPDRDLARAEELALKYNVTQPNVLVFDCDGRNTMTAVDDLVVMDYAAVLQGGAAQKIAFKGEQAFSSAIEFITQARKPSVYFLRGHGERELESRDREGYSKLKQEIERDNIALKALTLGDQPAIPADADALIIASPRVTFAESEIRLLRDYLDKDGRLLVMLDTVSDSGLEPLLEEWGIGVGQTTVVDPSRTLRGSDLFMRDFRPHAITKGLRGETCIFYLPRPVEPMAEDTQAQDRADKPNVVSLGQSTPDSWAETDRGQRPIRFDQGRDIPGPISLAVAAERGPLLGLDVSVKPARLVVFGDADFVSNAPLAGGNFDFFLSALNWLLEREELLAIAPKSVEEMRLVMDGAQLHLLFWILVVGLPGLVATLGSIVWLRRRS